MAEEAQRRIHAVDAGNELGGNIVTEVHISLAQRQQIEKQIERHPRIARYVPAIGENLPFDFTIKFAASPLHGR